MKRFIVLLLFYVLLTGAGGCGIFDSDPVIEGIDIPEVAVIDTHYLMDASVDDEDIAIEWGADKGTFTATDTYEGNKVEWKAPSSPGEITITLKAEDVIEDRTIEVIRPPVIAVDYNVYTQVGTRYGEITFQNNSGKDIKGMELKIIGWNDFNERIPTSLLVDDFSDYVMNARASDIDFPTATERTYEWYLGMSFLNYPSEIQAYVNRVAFTDGTTWELGEDEGLDDERIEGKVCINGMTPGRRVTVTLQNLDREEEIELKTNEQGYFAFDSVYYDVGDELEIVTGSVEDFSEDEIRENELVTWTRIFGINAQSDVMELPEIDLYNYNFELVDPEPGAEVTLPHLVKINHYERDVENRIYWMYFTDNFGNYLGQSKEIFEGTSFEFTGEFYDGLTLEEDAYWYVSCSYNKMGYDFLISIFGHWAELTQTEGKEIKNKIGLQDAPKELEGKLK